LVTGISAVDQLTAAGAAAGAGLTRVLGSIEASGVASSAREAFGTLFAKKSPAPPADKPQHAHAIEPPPGLRCVIGDLDVTADNYVEFCTAPSMSWHPAQMAEAAVVALLDTQFETYLDGLTIDSTNAEELSAAMKSGLREWINEPRGLPIPEGDTHVCALWFASDPRVERSAKLLQTGPQASQLQSFAGRSERLDQMKIASKLDKVAGEVGLAADKMAVEVTRMFGGLFKAKAAAAAPVAEPTVLPDGVEHGASVSQTTEPVPDASDSAGDRPTEAPQTEEIHQALPTAPADTSAAIHSAVEDKAYSADDADGTANSDDSEDEIIE
jgi:hypothetical protein